MHHRRQVEPTPRRPRQPAVLVELQRKASTPVPALELDVQAQVVRGPPVVRRRKSQQLVAVPHDRTRRLTVAAPDRIFGCFPPLQPTVRGFVSRSSATIARVAWTK
jgi:hypothetical protein